MAMPNLSSTTSVQIAARDALASRSAISSVVRKEVEAVLSDYRLAHPDDPINKSPWLTKSVDDAVMSGVDSMLFRTETGTMYRSNLPSPVGVTSEGGDSVPLTTVLLSAGVVPKYVEF